MIAQIMLQGGANINLASGDKGVSALHLAGLRKFVPIVELLLDLGEHHSESAQYPSCLKTCSIGDKSSYRHN